MQLGWLIRQLLPLVYVSEYGDSSGGRYVSVWQMWFGRVFNHRRWHIA